MVKKVKEKQEYAEPMLPLRMAENYADWEKLKKYSPTPRQLRSLFVEWWPDLSRWLHPRKGRGWKDLIRHARHGEQMSQGVHRLQAAAAVELAWRLQKRAGRPEWEAPSVLEPFGFCPECWRIGAHREQRCSHHSSHPLRDVGAPVMPGEQPPLLPGAKTITKNSAEYRRARSTPQGIKSAAIARRGEIRTRIKRVPVTGILATRAKYLPYLSRYLHKKKGLPADAGVTVPDILRLLDDEEFYVVRNEEQQRVCPRKELHSQIEEDPELLRDMLIRAEECLSRPRPKHGGARPGAGRKPKSQLKRRRSR